MSMAQTGLHVLSIVFTALAFVLSAHVHHNMSYGALFLLWAYPNALWVVWRMRDTIEAA